MANELRNQFNKFLQHLVESLDISESLYRQAEERYQSVGNWLGRDKSVVAIYAPEVYPQGSFRLGTVIKPINDADEYDIDLVCEINISKNKISQKLLKELVGQEIKGYAKYNNMNSGPEEGRRCWTLNYADGAQFHMDVLPAIPDGESFKILLESNGLLNNWSDHAIAITDNTLNNYDSIDTNWPRSNPRGYAEWFKSRMKIEFDNQRKLLAESINAKVEDVPDYRVKTPLQRVIQILKRHRDIMFAADQDDKPISIIISTLAAHAYQNEADFLGALNNIVNGMSKHIQINNGVSWVPNPVDPLENFADKWQEYPKKAANFRYWLDQVRDDLNRSFGKGNIHALSEFLKPRFGEKIINETMRHFTNKYYDKSIALTVGMTRLPSKFNVSHRQSPIWPVLPQYSVTISASYQYNGQLKPFNSNSFPLPKHRDLIFSARTNVPPPFNVYWQVVNTGEQAQSHNQLRGGIFQSENGPGALTHFESTAYTGMHWIECFIVKNGICLARSGEFIVNIE